MATIGDLTDILLRRVRDPQGQFHSRALVRRIVSNLQWQIYLALKPGLSQTTLATTPGINQYRLTSNSLGLRVMHIRDGGRDLTHLDNYSKLTYIDRQWWQRQGPRHEAWTMLGQDYLLLYPACPTSFTLDIVYVPMYTEYIIDTQTVFIPQEYHESLLRLAEGLILLRQRDFGAAQRAINQFIEESAPEFLAARLHVVQAPAESYGSAKEG